MNEMLLQFIWQYSLYRPNELYTTAGEPLTIIFPGKRNRDSGPDFSEARIRIGSTTLVGNIELHNKISDWDRHGHQADPSYQNIILHVVFRDDRNYKRPDFPVLELGPAIPAYVIDQYTNLIQTTRPIACARQVSGIPAIVRESWLNRLLAERWEQKLEEWKDQLRQSAGDWSLLLYWRLAANFGFKVNAVPFLMLAQSIPLTVLARHKDNLMQIEALLFGQAGMLEADFEDPYPMALQTEYRYLKRKYNLVPIVGHLWKFLRMRPANFPTVRIAQFAALIHRSVHLFAQVTSTYEVAAIRELLQVTASSYWDNHFHFGEQAARSGPKSLGNTSADNIIINTIAPLQFLYAHYHGQQIDQERALQLLSLVSPEENNIIETWEEAGWKPQNALQSQAMLQLFHQYCEPKRCLECALGLNIIRSRPAK